MRLWQYLGEKPAAIAGILAVLVACGGGGDSVSGPITPAPAIRTDLLFGYYHADANGPNETADHANLHWAGYAAGPAEQMAGLIQARANGQRVVLMLPAYDFPLERREAEVGFWLDRLAAAGLLWDGIVALYPVDEPELQNLSDADVTATNAAIRRAMARLPALARTALAVFYSCNSGARPGLASFDWVGCDDYERGCAVLGPSAAVPDLLRALRPDQRLMVIPGGADPWRQDPACFAAYAHREPRVAAIVAFLWRWPPGTGGGAPGIANNPTRRLYCETGRAIVGNPSTCA